MRGAAISGIMDNHRDLLKYPDGPLKPLRRITLSATGWGNTNADAPISLTNLTDIDPATITGEGSNTVTSGQDIGQISADLGGLKNVLLVMKLGLKADSSIAINGSLEGSADNTNWPVLGRTPLSVTLGTGYVSYFMAQPCLNVEYIRLRLTAAGAGKYYFKGYELKAYDLGD